MNALQKWMHDRYVNKLMRDLRNATARLNAHTEAMKKETEKLVRRT